MPAVVLPGSQLVVVLLAAARSEGALGLQACCHPEPGRAVFARTGVRDLLFRQVVLPEQNSNTVRSRCPPAVSADTQL